MEQESTIVIINNVDSLVQQVEESTIVFVGTEDTVVQELNATTIVLEPEETTIIGGFVQGVQGPPGQDYTYINILSAENINGHRAINILGNMSNTPFLGISTGSAVSGDLLQVQQTGYLIHSGWNWVPGDPIYALDSGVLTQAFPLSGNLVIVGYGVTPTKMFIKQEPAILLG